MSFLAQNLNNAWAIARLLYSIQEFLWKSSKCRLKGERRTAEAFSAYLTEAPSIGAAAITQVLMFIFQQPSMSLKLA